MIVLQDIVNNSGDSVGDLLLINPLQKAHKG